jgi:hypothetical protein
MIMWQVLCPETGWRSPPVPDRNDAERQARNIDAEIARVNGASGHAHPVVEVLAGRTASISVGRRS